MAAALAQSSARRGRVPAAAGIGLRFPHQSQLLQQLPAVAWLEVHTENYMGGGAAIAALAGIRQHYPLSLHGVGLSLGSAEGIDLVHLRQVAEVAERVAPGLISEHLSWSQAGTTWLPDLLPLPMTEESLAVVCRNVDCTQALLRRAILLENPSSYLRFAHSPIPEAEFLAEVCRRTGCGLLLDLNNLQVSAMNHGWDTAAYLQALPTEAVGEMHLAGHSVVEIDGHTLRIDDHGSPVPPEVWALYRQALQRFGRVPTLIEWDTDLPPLATLLAEADKAQHLLDHHASLIAAQPARTAAAVL
ncbi:MNIO family bufferin maturase [Ideonella azotifigens]|uniref:MNIO family bufferin maturase n=1 Tax=Ideonella azotifigens TaxID=513160 RepID=UPI001141EFA8|nr:DUF692 domain-containing protein [Ideonella azotifigens]